MPPKNSQAKVLTMLMMTLFSQASLANALKSSKKELALSKNFWAEFSNSSILELAHLSQAINAYNILRPEIGLSGRKSLRIGSSQLYEFGIGTGIPILVIPSMINKAYIMDLPSQSFIQSLCEQGFKPYVIEWGDPGKLEATMDFNDFIHRTNQFVDYVLGKHNGPLALLGYCMGGIMATLYASKYPKKVSSIVQLASPWDFAVGGFLRVNPSKLKKCFENQELVPKEFFQLGFYITKFRDVNRKYIEFVKNPANASSFAQIESWVDDGVDMPKAVFEQLMDDIVYQNKLILGSFSLGNSDYDVKVCTAPVLSIIATKDSLVPAASSIAISSAIPKSDIVYLNTGHVGLVTALRDEAAETIKLWLVNKKVNKQLTV